jgi:hypothetical protein
MRHTRKKYNKHTHKRSGSKRSGSKRSGSKSRSFKHFGGEASIIPFESLGFPLGASSPREAALKIAQENDNKQFLMNRQSGGKTRQRRKTRQSGGSEDAKTLEVPQFPPIGGIQTAYTTTDLSKLGNLVNITGASDAKNDCYATDSCPKEGGARKRRSTSKRSRRRSNSKRKSRRK